MLQMLFVMILRGGEFVKTVSRLESINFFIFYA